jgi:hypothetical protein
MLVSRNISIPRSGIQSLIQEVKSLFVWDEITYRDEIDLDIGFQETRIDTVCSFFLFFLFLPEPISRLHHVASCCIMLHHVASCCIMCTSGDPGELGHPVDPHEAGTEKLQCFFSFRLGCRSDIHTLLASDMQGLPLFGKVVPVRHNF